MDPRRAPALLGKFVFSFALASLAGAIFYGTDFADAADLIGARDDDVGEGADTSSKLRRTVFATSADSSATLTYFIVSARVSEQRLRPGLPRA